MKRKKTKYLRSILTLTLLTLGLVPVIAADSGHNQKESSTIQEARLESMILTMYAMNEHLYDNHIQVEVSEEEARLMGHVDNDLELALAKQIALGVDHIDEVDNRLKVGPDESEKERPIGLFGLLDNASKTAAVKTRLLWNKDIAGTKINVDTTGDVMVLEGTVPSEEAAKKAIEIAKDTSGIAKVKNRLKVVDTGPTVQQQLNARLNEAGSEISDAWIASAAKANLLYSNKIKGSDINVDCEDGVVSLSGEVQTELHRDLAVAMTRKITGVQDVDAGKLEIK